MQRVVRRIHRMKYSWKGNSQGNVWFTIMITYNTAMLSGLLIFCGLSVPKSFFDDGPCGLTFSWWECYGLRARHKLTELAHSLFCSCVWFCLYGPFNCISFHKFSRQLSDFSLCSSGLISALLALLIMYLFMKVSLSPDIILCGWLGLKHKLTN